MKHRTADEEAELQYQYHTCDVFTDRPFTGNPLAVFPEADGLTAEQMQLVARELSLPETAFVLPAQSGGDFWLRIFTPSAELPFAGHPTIGTALVLARLGRVAKGRGAVFEEGAGPVPVSLEWEGDAASAAWLTAPRTPERVAAAPAPRLIARALSLDERDIDLAGPDPVVLSAGNPFLFVALKSRTALSRAKVSSVDWQRAMEGVAASGVYLFCPEPEAPWAHFRARLFAPDKGISEDPATGSAASALPGYLLAGDGALDGEHRWEIEQGVEMGRPSRLRVEATVRGKAIVTVRVGGGAVPMSEGTMEVA